MKNFEKLINNFDYFLLLLVIFAFMGDLIDLISSLVNHLYSFYQVNDLISYMVNSGVGTTSTSATTTTQIVHDDGSWANGIRSLFIYGTGAFRLGLQRGGGTAASRSFVIATTIAADGLSRAINNTINDPNYVQNHIASWRAIWADQNNGVAEVKVDSATQQLLQNASTNSNSSQFLGDGGGLDALANNLITNIIEHLKFILEPVQVSYSNKVLATQIYDISILLFILSILIIGLFIAFIINVFILVNTDKILNFIKNKYIRWYVIFNKKIINIEIFILGGSLLYFMYTLSIGIRFIATHPVVVS